ncbi:hypothetical protein [Thiomonas sp. FB-Cd]|nr:hypothetical protein [Thiomonas sp. FB-Cd]
MSDDAQNIFTDLPDGLGEDEFYFGAIVPGMGSMVTVEVRAPLLRRPIA